MFMEQEEFELQWVASLQQGIKEDTDSITPELLMLRQQRECFHYLFINMNIQINYRIYLN